jgi:HD-GYP domain-containing protein (c-di-GMP phosphodiesterase class II)
MDGSGYPKGMSGQDISIGARVLAVADVIEAISSHRPYRPSLGIGKALEEISQKRGILYDAEVVDAVMRLVNEKGFKFW